MNTSEKVEMWLEACRKISQGIKMEWCDTYIDDERWELWQYSKNEPNFPDFDPDVIWREFEDRTSPKSEMTIDEKFEEYLNVLRKIRAGIRMEYNATYWGNDEYIEWDEVNLPGFDASHTWRECQPKSIETVKIRQITIVPKSLYDCNGQVTISLHVNMDDGEPETVHYVKPGNPFYIVI